MGKNVKGLASNVGLNKAGNAKRDEFYTTLQDIEAEMEYYPDCFRGKTVLCNCDDPYESNFFWYFVRHFNRLKLKKLICISYAGAAETRMGAKHYGQNGVNAYGAIVTSVDTASIHTNPSSMDVDKVLQFGGNEFVELAGDGDFRSSECISILREADVVVTNPPFSLFREYILQLIEYDKKFLIVGNINAVTYKEVFPLIQKNRIWLGASIHSGDRKFYVPDSYEMKAAGCGVDHTGRKYIRVKGVRWFTNLDYIQRHQSIALLHSFDSIKYPKYENYNAVNVGRSKDIPCDYTGIMGVPITFIDKYNPDEFEIVMLANGNARTNVDARTLSSVGYRHHKEDRGGVGIIDGKRVYARILIRKKQPELHVVKVV